MDKTSSGLAENVGGLLCYVLGWISGIIFILIEQENKFVRLHAVQSIYVFSVLTVANLILGWLPIIGGILAWIFGVVGFILWIVLMVKAYQGVKYKVPWAGDFAEKRSG